MKREHILSEIRRTAVGNDGVPLGRARFAQATGIREADWLGKYWVRWADAVREAGLAPNRLQAKYSDERVLSSLAGVVEGLGHFPTVAELRLAKRHDPSLPNSKVFTRFGNRAQQAAALGTYAESRSELAGVRAICAALGADEPATESLPQENPPIGDVYLLKSGRHYKIGRSNAAGRRERELAIQLPERATVVHVIKTDDPPGIEAYWHRRFGDRRKNGEWFELTAAEVRAFRRRRFM